MFKRSVNITRIKKNEKIEEQDTVLVESPIDLHVNSEPLVNIICLPKNLKELAKLGMNSNYPQIQKAIKWLLERPQSSYNPGMFFLTDELVAEQQEIINRRNEQTVGPKERFRKRPRSELKLIHAVDEL